MTNPIITITDEAAKHIQTMVKKEESLGFRLSIKKSGCSGYAYAPEIIKQIDSNDVHFVSHGLNVYLDKNAIDFIKNLIIDYVFDDKSGLKQRRLVFINPNEKNRCGCGESFTVE